MVLSAFQAQLAQLLKMGRMKGTETRKFALESADGGLQVSRAAAAGTKPVQRICGGGEGERERERGRKG